MAKSGKNDAFGKAYGEPKGTMRHEAFKKLASMVVYGSRTTIHRDGTRVDRNASCPCGSGNKFKKCCGMSESAQRAKLKAAVPKVDASLVEAVGSSLPGQLATGNETVLAMLNSGLRKELVWAFKTTGLFITTMNRSVHAPEDVERWDAAVAEWAAMPMAKRNEILAEYGHQIKEEADAASSTTTDEPARAASSGDDGGLRTSVPEPSVDAVDQHADAASPAEVGGDAGVS